MPLTRYGRPGLLGVIDPSCVVAGAPALTAAISRRAAQRREQPQPSAAGQTTAHQTTAHQTTEQAVAEAEAEAEAAERAAEQYATFGHQPQPVTTGHDDLASSLGELARLRDRGALSSAEYETAKARLLGA